MITSVIFGFAVFGGIYTTLFNLYLLRLGYGPQFAGVVNGVGQVAFGLCALPIGMLGRFWGSRRLLIAGLSLMAIGFGLTPLAEFSPISQKSWLVGSQIMAQIGICVYFVNGAPYVMAVTTPAERNHVFAASLALTPLAGFTGSIVGGFLPGMFARVLNVSLNHPAPYRYSLLLAAMLIFLAVSAIVKTRTKDTPVRTRGQKKSPAPVGIFAAIGLAVLLRVVGEGAIRTFLNIYLDTQLQIPVAQIGVLLAVGQLLAVPASMLMPVFAARWGIGLTYIYSTWFMAFSFLPMAFVPHWAAAGLGYMGVMTFLAIARPAIVAFQMEVVSSDWRTMMSGTTSSAVGLGWAVASLSGGFIITTSGYMSLFLLGAAMTAAAAIIFGAYFRPQQAKPSTFSG